jgi:tetratricopeptide (TPR) repeat protein
MSYKIPQWIGLVGITATIPLVQVQGATAKTSVEIAETAKAITVLITNPKGTGSGVILQQQGDIYTVLTAAHVVQQTASYKITTSDDRSHEAISSSIRRAPGSIDLAVIQFKSTTKYPIAKLGNCNDIKSGMDLYVGGFPGETRAITQLVFVFREGKVSANSNKIFENGYSLVYSNNTLPGMSGGAVLNSDGELVAIHGRGDRDKDDNKTGFNLGIPVNRFVTIASNMGVELREKIAPVPQNTVPRTDDYIASAAQKYNNKDYKGALADYNLAIELNPNDAITYNYRGYLKYWALKDTKGGLADYNRAIQLDAKLAIAYFNRAWLKSHAGKDDRGGLADYNSAIQLNPNNPVAYYNRGNLKERFKDPQGALADYNRAIQLDPTDRQNYGLTYSKLAYIKAFNLEDFQGSIADWNRYIQIYPNDYGAYANRGLMKKQLNDVQGALADYNKSIQLDSTNNSEAYFYRASLKEKKIQDIPSALADYDRAIQINSHFAAAYERRAKLRHDILKDRSGAIQDLKQAARFYQEDNDLKSYQSAINLLKKWSK